MGKYVWRYAFLSRSHFNPPAHINKRINTNQAGQEIHRKNLPRYPSAWIRLVSLADTMPTAKTRPHHRGVDRTFATKLDYVALVKRTKWKGHDMCALCHKFCWRYAANPVLLFHCASLFDQSPYVVSMRSSTSNELSSTAPIGVSSRSGPRVSPGCPSQFHTIHDLKFLTAVLHDWKLLGTNAELQKWEIHGNSKKFPSPEDTVCSKMFQNFDLSRSFFRLSLTFLPVPGSRFPSSPSSCRRGSGTCPRRK